LVHELSPKSMNE